MVVEGITVWVESAAKQAWGPGLLALLLGAGAYFTVGSGFFPLRKAGFIWRSTLGGMWGGRGREKGISPFAAMSTALGATVGTGNIVGVAAALAAGGPGAVFWMWVGAAAGMMTKFAEAVLALRYREPDEHGWRGGAMYYIERGLGIKPLAAAYAALCAAASFGMGNLVQVSAAAETAKAAVGLPEHATGLLMAALCAAALFAGAEGVTKIASLLVPFMALGYMAGCGWVLIENAGEVPGALASIFSEAFSFDAAGGGAFGTAVRVGVSRGAFTNEAGMGSAAAAHAASSERDPAAQGCWGILEVFIDTIAVCTLTALVLMTGGTAGAGDTAAAFSDSFGSAGGWFIAAAMFLFALATVLGWAFYGEGALLYLTGGKSSVLTAYRLAYVAAALLGAGIRMPLVWGISDIMNALMAFPNLAALLVLSPQVFRAAWGAGKEKAPP